MGQKLKRKIATLALAAIFAFAGARAVFAQVERPQEPAPSTSKSAPLQDLRSMDELREAFNRDAGKIRLILLLSPT
jgi:hypothetical protein